MCPAYAKKAGIECKKWAKFVPGSVEQVQSRTGMEFVPVVFDPATHHFLHLGQRQKHNTSARLFHIGHRDPNRGMTFDLIYV
jgi:hypothetical protein